MIRMAVCMLAVVAFLSPTAVADLILLPGTKIVFGDNSELASAPADLSIPAGHGGTGNTVSGTDAFVGGGSNNTVTADRGTISGGGDTTGTTANKVTDAWGTVGGGRENRAGDAAGTSSDQPYGTVGGGWNNIASGYAATIPGGRANVASANYTFAAGRRAKSTADGAFTFADSTNSDFTNNSANSFRVRASGGIYLFSNAALSEYFALNSSGTALITGDLYVGGTVFETSDRNLKENFQPIDEHTILEKILNLPLQRYNYRKDDPSQVHMGPMAQDFHDAFGLGDDSNFIASVDADGVALAGIQALYDMVQERDRRIEKLESELSDISARLAALEQASGR